MTSSLPVFTIRDEVVEELRRHLASNALAYIIPALTSSANEGGANTETSSSSSSSGGNVTSAFLVNWGHPVEYFKAVVRYFRAHPSAYADIDILKNLDMRGGNKSRIQRALVAFLSANVQRLSAGGSSSSSAVNVLAASLTTTTTSSATTSSKPKQKRKAEHAVTSSSSTTTATSSSVIAAKKHKSSSSSSTSTSNSTSNSDDDDGYDNHPFVGFNDHNVPTSGQLADMIYVRDFVIPHGKRRTDGTVAFNLPEAAILSMIATVARCEADHVKTTFEANHREVRPTLEALFEYHREMEEARMMDAVRIQSETDGEGFRRERAAAELEAKMAVPEITARTEFTASSILLSAGGKFREELFCAPPVAPLAQRRAALKLLMLERDAVKWYGEAAQAFARSRAPQLTLPRVEAELEEWQRVLFTKPEKDAGGGGGVSGLGGGPPARMLECLEAELASAQQARRIVEPTTGVVVVELL